MSLVLIYWLLEAIEPVALKVTPFRSEAFPTVTNIINIRIKEWDWLFCSVSPKVQLEKEPFTSYTHRVIESCSSLELA